MSEVGEVFVKIRPNTAGFKEEATGPVASAGTSLAKTFLAAFAIGGIAETIKSAIGAATEHQAAFAVLSQTTKDAGAATTLFGQSIEALLEKEARLKGFSDEDLASSFTRLVSATKSSKEAFSDLGLAEDVARARHIALANAALAISKAEQGSATALQRLGIVVPAVTKNVDALKTAHENAIIAGAKFTDQQKQQYAQALANAAAADKQATRVQDLAVIQQRFGGDAASFADTTAGGFARLQAEFHQFEVTLGTNVLPLLLSGAQDAIDFVKALDNPAVIGAVGTYAGLKIALEGISLAQSAYQKILIAGGATRVGEAAAATTATGATSALTEAILANTAAIQGNVVAVAEATTIYDAYGGTLATVAAETDTLAASNAVLDASTGALEGGSILAGLGALASGPGAIVLGIAAVAGGIAYLATREGEATQATHGLEDALKSLGTAQQQLPTDRLSVSQDKLNVRHDNTAVSVSKASHSSLEYQQLLLNLDRDTLQLEADQKTLGQTLATVADDFDKAKNKAIALADVEQAGTKPRRVGEVDFGSSLSQQQQLQQRATATYAKGIEQVIAASSGLTTVQAHNLQLLEQYAEVIGKIPTRAQTTLILDNKDATLSLDQFLNEIQGLPRQTAAESAASGRQIVANINDGVLAGASQLGLKGLVQNEIDELGSLVPAAQSQGEAIGGAFFTGVENALHSLDPVFAAVKAQIAANAKLAQTTDPLKQQIASDQTDLSNLQQQANDAAVQGAQALAGAIQSAKTNLDSIGQSIASSLSTFIDKPLTDAAARIQDAQAKLSLLGDQRSLKNLSEEVLLPGSRQLSADPTKAIAQLQALQKKQPNDPALAQFILQYRSLALQVAGDKNGIQQAAAGLVTTAAQTRIANLTDLFNTGKISQGTLEKDITAILEKNGLTAKTARTRGASFADTLAGEFTGVSQQASALKGFGDNSGLIPSITRPIDTLNATQKTLAGIASSERAKQLSESKTQTTLLKDIHAAQKADAFTSSLDHNPGTKTKRGVDLVGSGG